ncbi:PET123 [Candida pseudojiufengensis]|uniref:PET123 n=1 Tax=Candida pseudojiufengensis TaxID=497109 RepID=UPI002224251F|nr:PET123 [Candida pseudojiufengensis]KAI5962933.1 PET123 [Candida pseudojiufengensis]
MGKGILKYGGKSGILPKTKQIFHRPIRPMNEVELQKEKNKESGYAEGVPTPIINGKPLPRKQPPRKYITVEDRIKHIKYPPMSLKEMNDLPEEERDAYKRAYYRAEFLKEAYLEEEKRLAKIDQLKTKIHEKELENQRKFEEQRKIESIISSLPTMQKLLKEGLIKKRTPDENKLLKEQRKLNRHSKELAEKEEKASKILELYHSSSKFITNEEQLEEAIYRAFEINVSKFENNQTSIDNKLFSNSSSFIVGEINEMKIKDAILGEINGKPGLEQVKDTLSGNRERLRREAQLNMRGEV